MSCRSSRAASSRCAARCRPGSRCAGSSRPAGAGLQRALPRRQRWPYPERRKGLRRAEGVLRRAGRAGLLLDVEQQVGPRHAVPASASSVPMTSSAEPIARSIAGRRAIRQPRRGRRSRFSTHRPSRSRTPSASRPSPDGQRRPACRPAGWATPAPAGEQEAHRSPTTDLHPRRWRASGGAVSSPTVAAAGQPGRDAAHQGGVSLAPSSAARSPPSARRAVAEGHLRGQEEPSAARSNRPEVPGGIGSTPGWQIHGRRGQRAVAQGVEQVGDGDAPRCGFVCGQCLQHGRERFVGAGASEVEPGRRAQRDADRADAEHQVSSLLFGQQRDGRHRDGHPAAPWWPCPSGGAGASARRSGHRRPWPRPRALGGGLDLGLRPCSA